MMNLFTALVGASSKGRKGSSWSHVLHLVRRVDAEWAERNIGHGLVSGEGLIWAVRDPIEKQKRLGKKERETRGNAYETVIEDPGVKDKRLFVIEAEFARILRVLRREGNTLSAVIRSAWDSGDMRSMTKNDPSRASGAHISIVAHVTKYELLKYLGSTEAGNGFGNRFLWFCVRRSKFLPDGGSVPDGEMLGLGLQVADAVSFARKVTRLDRSEEARVLWHERYRPLSEGRPGLLGAMLGRAEAQVMRLACLYALLDCSDTVERTHLESALELWDYSERSAEFIFGSALGDPQADRILAALRGATGGLRRTEIGDLFQRHLSKSDTDRCLSLLEELGLACREAVETGGRPAEKWFAVEHARKAQEVGHVLREEALDASLAFRAPPAEEGPR
jgi:hypothetical protein